jgi:chromatin remodeling complex protein RSC6
MVRAVKTTTTTEKQSTAPVSVATDATKTPRTKKTKAVAEVQVTPATPVVSTTDAPIESVEASSVIVKMTEFGAKLQQLVGLFSTVKNDFKTLEKTVAREMKIAQKASSKRKRTGAARQPSGFVKPTRISDELAEFLGKTIGTEMARTSVSKEINAYIRANNLQDVSNGRKINPDAKLLKLLKLSKSDELTYFNLQKYMKHHFVKAADLAAAAAAAAAATA